MVNTHRKEIFVPSYDYETLHVEIVDRVLLLTLNRPEQLNAFTVTMADELEHFFGAVNDDDDVGAVVVTGAGKAYCAGMDLRREGNVFGLDETLRPTLDDMRHRLDDPAIARGVRDTGGRVTLAIHNCLKPVIAAINGDAVGIGATMTLAMDFRLASRNARVGFVFGRLGIVPEACSSWFLPRVVGLQTALEWTMTADIIGAEEAHKAGLLRSLHDDRDALLAEAMKLARRIIDNRSSVAIAMTRQMMWRNPALPSPLDVHRIDSLVVFYASLADGAEGVAAFKEKRKPEFKGKASAMPAPYPWFED
jgi:enoyl-CoA hydratase/carnithine racemase